MSLPCNEVLTSMLRISYVRRDTTYPKWCETTTNPHKSGKRAESRVGKQRPT
ncbi:hypothetical protein PISMIDRAFT_680554 [Pisolithus microcarpus 441]|uniref:Uncharacterized protein n=1 Tax=Pisolithus microcarpus 441 TaxID=765257 RepID=A0A0C9YBU3_9AGAM|nr:hypothetical protein PISMIDRAFT_680554 [Pisolithus microcarpus 441]